MCGGVGLDGAVDLVSGVWVEEGGMMVVTVRRWEGVEKEGVEVRQGGQIALIFAVKGLGVGRRGIYVDGSLMSEKVVREKGEEAKVKV